MVACLILVLATVPIGRSETKVIFRGLNSVSQQEMRRSINDRLTYLREQPANPWRANDAAFLVERILRKKGFSEAEVTAEIEASDRVVLVVREGSRRTLGSIEINGLDTEQDDLKNLFRSAFRQRGLIPTESTPFLEEDLDQGLDFVKRSLQSDGYWRVEVDLRKVAVNPDTGKVDVVMDVERGPRFRIASPEVDSPDGRGVKRAATTWEPFIGEWATTANVTKLNKEMVEAFASRGYPDAEVFLNRRLGKDTYHPEFRIELGVRVKLLGVETEGLVRTKPERVKQVMEPLVGDWYNQEAMNEKVSELLETGAFRSVQIRTEEVSRKRIQATLRFEESRGKEVALSAGAGTFYGPLFRAQYLDRNFRGKLKAFSAGLEVNSRGLLGELKLTEPWWRGTDLSHELRLYSLLEAYEGYTTFETGVGSAFNWNVTERFKIAFAVNYSFVNVQEKGLPRRFIGGSAYHHTRVRITPKWDFRDNSVSPKSGWHLSFPIQFGTAVDQTVLPYMKLAADGGLYVPLGDNYQYGVGGSIEWVAPAGDIRDLPIDLRAFNGGSRSVRSFPERRLGPSFEGDPYGGELAWSIQNELSRQIAGPLQLVGFVDAGGVSGNRTPPEGGGVELAAGLGLRIDLPIGPMRLEYGHNLTRDSGEPSGTWHFAVGATF